MPFHETLQLVVEIVLPGSRNRISSYVTEIELSPDIVPIIATE